MGRLSKLSILLLGAAVLALAAVPAVVGGAPRTASTKRVSVKDNFFSPHSVTIRRGGKVTWTWRGQLDHNVRFRKVPRGASRRGSSTKSSGRFTRSFSKRGRYTYVCTIHAPDMRGSVVVK
jgi:plastocyanin